MLNNVAISTANLISNGEFNCSFGGKFQTAWWYDSSTFCVLLSSQLAKNSLLPKQSKWLYLSNNSWWWQIFDGLVVINPRSYIMVLGTPWIFPRWTIFMVRVFQCARVMLKKSMSRSRHTRTISFIVTDCLSIKNLYSIYVCQSQMSFTTYALPVT